MKKVIIIALAVIGSFFTTNSFAQDNIPAAVTQSLQYSFDNITQASWSKVSDLYKAEFIFKDQVVSAFYNSDGDLVATGRDIEIKQMPIALQLELDKNYKGFSVTKSMEVNIADEDTYYVTINKDTKVISLSSTSYGTWKVYKKSNPIY